MAGLRLDIPNGAFADRSGRYAIVPGKPQDCLVVKRITSKDSPMPPRGSGKALTKPQIQLLTRWIAEGAHYAKLWSFEPLRTVVPVPAVKGSWPKNDIDRFVLARLKREGLSPTKPADRARWLRRVTLDLTGLPPTPSELDRFIGDRSTDAFEKVVDRLLASPSYGERLAVEWLDAARYSDSYGYQSDLLMPTWPYRDWVVKSFNLNLPYDQFLTAQVAGDLLPNPTSDQRLATAFNRLHRQSNEGGSIPLDFKTEYGVDRVSTFGTAFLGLTVGCARCHDHKFDPITQKDFYRLFAYFNSIDEYGLLLSSEIVPTPSLLLPTPAQAPKLKALRAASDRAIRDWRNERSALSGRYAEWLRTKPKAEIPGVLARFSFDEDAAGKFTNKVDGRPSGERLGTVKLVPGRSGNAATFDGDDGIAIKGLPARERWEPFTWSFWVKDPRQKQPVVLLHRTGGTDVGFCGFDLTLEDGYLTARVMRHWPGNAVAKRTVARIPRGAWTHVAWSWNGFGNAKGLSLYVNGTPVQTSVLMDKLWKKINAYGDLSASGGDWCFGQRFRDAGFRGGALDEVVFANRELSRIEVAQLGDGKSLDAAVSSPRIPSVRPGGDNTLEEYFERAIDPRMAAATKAVLNAQMALANYEDGVNEISVMEESKRPVPTYLLERGRYDAPRTEANRVTRGVPASLPPLPSGVRNDRLALAKWATQPNHPLTARVAVNRLWQMVFGVGLVETSENFGAQGMQPSHPELLDYLARRFVDSGWNVKALLKDMVLSATYRQDSARTAKGQAVDPTNRLLARGPAGRLSAEMVRDTALAAAGLLNRKVGGPSVNAYQPAGIWQEFNTMSPGFVQSTGTDLYRRSLYSTWKRTTPVPSMMLFDATSREACTMRRPSTNTPLQALVLLNDVQYVEAARVLAESVLTQPGSDEDRIRRAFVRLAGRAPDTREIAVLIQTLNEQRAEFAADLAGAGKLIHVGDSKPSPSLEPRELAAMTVTVQTILNSDAVIWKR